MAFYRLLIHLLLLFALSSPDPPHGSLDVLQWVGLRNYMQVHEYQVQVPVTLTTSQDGTAAKVVMFVAFAGSDDDSLLASATKFVLEHSIHRQTPDLTLTGVAQRIAAAARYQIQMSNATRVPLDSRRHMVALFRRPALAAAAAAPRPRTIAFEFFGGSEAGLWAASRMFCARHGEELFGPAAKERCDATVAVEAADPKFAWATTCEAAMSTRFKIGSYLMDRGLTGAAVEVGVQRGISARAMLNYCPLCGPLALVDPWTTQPESTYNDDANRVGDSGQNANLQETRLRIAPYRNRTIILRTYSVDAARMFLDESLDYVYLDGRHDYEGVKEDLLAWWPKIKPGGLLAGDDYNLATSGVEQLSMVGKAGSLTDFGVKLAFDEFIERHRGALGDAEAPGFALGSWGYQEGEFAGRFSCNFGVHKKK